jgi:hypothetical protein
MFVPLKEEQEFILRNCSSWTICVQPWRFPSSTPSFRVKAIIRPKQAPSSWSTMTHSPTSEHPTTWTWLMSTRATYRWRTRHVREIEEVLSGSFQSRSNEILLLTLTSNMLDVWEIVDRSSMQYISPIFACGSVSSPATSHDCGPTKSMEISTENESSTDNVPFESNVKRVLVECHASLVSVVFYICLCHPVIAEDSAARSKSIFCNSMRRANKHHNQ